MSKHTPGPWNIVQDQTAGEPMQDIMAWNYTVCSDVEKDANALLIAAAPELLEALEKIVRVSGTSTEHYLIALNALKTVEKK